MNDEDEEATYLKLFNESSHNFLLHSTEDGLNDTFPVESIFTEINSDWPSEGFPILLSGPLVAEDNVEKDITNAHIQFMGKDDECEPQTNNAALNGTLTFYSDIPNNSLIVSNDLLVKLQEAESNGSSDSPITHVINGDTYSVTYSQGNQEDATEVNENVEVIQLLDIDGSVTTIDKNLLTDTDPKKTVIVSEFYSQVQANKCKLCDFLCESVEDMVTHINVKHSTEIQNGKKSCENPFVGNKLKSILNVNQNKEKYLLYLCSNCGSGFSNKEDLKQHMINQHKMVEVTSEAATPAEPAPIQLTKSLSTSLLKAQKTRSKVKCSIKGCPLGFDKEEMRKKHEDCHVDQHKKRFMCPVCKTKFSLWRICCVHLWKSHQIDVGLKTCPICNKFKSYSPVCVMNHMAIHKEERPFVCSACGKDFKQLNQLRNHAIVHKDPSQLPDSYLSRQCNICDRFFANSKSLKKHIKFVHDKFKPFICNICGHQTARKEMLQLHHRQHTGDKPFQCSYCDYKTADKNCLQRHTMRHFGVAKYSCQYCSYQSIQATVFKNHIMSKHPGKEGTYSCKLCRYSTINCRSYMSHLKNHELEQKKKAKGKIEKGANVEDSESKSSDETHNFLNPEQLEEAVDTGGITIPAGFDLQLSTDPATII